jgi:hypothetical protein
LIRVCLFCNTPLKRNQHEGPKGFAKRKFCNPTCYTGARTNYLPEDGVIDYVAIGIAASGIRRVRLTQIEMELAAQRIIANYGSEDDLTNWLGIEHKRSAKLLRKYAKLRPANWVPEPERDTVSSPNVSLRRRKRNYFSLKGTKVA